MFRARVVDTLRHVDRDAWNALFPGEPENYDYLSAIEDAGLDGFAWRYVLAENEGRLVAAAPGFVTDYPLETTLEDAGRRIVQRVRKVLPALTTLRMACLGSPCTETAQIGWAADVADDAERDTLTRLLLAAFEAAAQVERCGLIAIKDIPAPQAKLWSTALKLAGFSAAPGLAVAEIAVDFANLDDYLDRLSGATRKDMRRKLRGACGVQIEVRRDIAGVEDRVMALYAQTRERGDLQFETLTAAYFTGVLERMGAGAVCLLYFVGDELLAANLLLIGDGVLLDKFFCMSAKGRPHNLYFLSWFTNLQLCLDNGLTRYQSGQAAYANKLRLGSRLTPTTLHFRHRNPLLNLILKALAPLLAPTGAAGVEATP